MNTRRAAGAAEQEKGSVLSVPAVRIIVVNYRSEVFLERCLAAVARQSFADFEIVVVDNGSSGEAIVHLLPDDPRFRVLLLGENAGFAVANNRGAEGARTRWIATLNPDAFPEPDWLERLMEATERHPAEMYGSTQIMADAQSLYDGTGDCLSAWGLAFRSNYSLPIAGPAPAGFCFAPCAAAALYARSAFEAAGGFDERFFCYVEDVDLAFRIRLLGGRCWQVDSAKVLHVGSGTTGRGSDFSLFHGFRNQVWMLLKCVPAPFLALVLLLHCLALAVLLLRLHPEPRATILSGLKAACRGARGVWRTRARIQATRRVSGFAVMRMLMWNPFAFRRREPNLWTEETGPLKGKFTIPT